MAYSTRRSNEQVFPLIQSHLLEALACF